MIYAGIDEAGYGPMLGPLCVGVTVFQVEGDCPRNGPPDLWKRLSSAVCRSRRDRRSRIAVEDSKRLKGTGKGKQHPLLHLERGVLCFAAAAAGMPDSDEAFFRQVLGELPSAPWYGSQTQLPLAQDEGQLRIASSRLERAMAAADVICHDLRCQAIDVKAFNEQVDRLGNKAHVNLAAAFRHIDSIWQRWPNEHPRVLVDRQGGRTHYREDLQQAYPEASITILAEDTGLSRYRLDQGGRQLTVSFATEAESRYFPVALASMVAKYTRELHMVRLNRFFRGHMPELKPTAGYVADARRYLEEIDALIRRLKLPRPELVRKV